MITATMVDRFPPEIKLFRSYKDPEKVINNNDDNNYDDRGEDESNHQDDQSSNNNYYCWKVGRATGAAPTYFAQCDSYIDGKY